MTTTTLSNQITNKIKTLSSTCPEHLLAGFAHKMGWVDRTLFVALTNYRGKFQSQMEFKNISEDAARKVAEQCGLPFSII